MRYILTILAILVGATTVAVGTVAAAGYVENPVRINVEQNGDLWYVHDTMRYSLRTPQDTYDTIRAVALGITNEHLATIPLALTNSSGNDTDGDGLSDRFEDAIGSDIQNSDTDGDGFTDREEVANGYAVLGAGSQDIDMHLAKRLAGSVLLQIEQNGEAWYVHPETYERHYLGTPDQARALFASVALGSKSADLAQYTIANSIVSVASATDSVSTLVSAVVAADLVDTLQSDGPFTVFAPTNEAFAKLPAEQFDAILADKDLLTSILTYHVVPGYFTATDVLRSDSLQSVQGESITVNQNPGAAVNQANIIATNVRAGNGVIHLIDEVILPPSLTQTESLTEGQTTMTTLIDVAREAGNFTTLLTAIEAAGLTETLSSDGLLTVFAPTDDAFAAIDAETLQALLDDPETLAGILTYHVVPGSVLASDVVNQSAVTTVQGSDLTINAGDDVQVNDATILATDILADNGVIHVIDTVLLP